MIPNRRRRGDLGSVRPVQAWTSASSPNRGLQDGDDYLTTLTSSTTVLFLRALRAVGVAPVNIEKRRVSYAVTLSRSYALYYSVAKFAIIGVIALAGFVYEVFFKNPTANSLMSLIIKISFFVTGWFVIAICTIRNRTRTTRFLHYLNKIQEIYGNIKSNASSEVHVKQLKFQLIIGAGWAFIMSIIKIISLLTTDQSSNPLLMVYYNELFYLNSVLINFVELQTMHVIQCAHITLLALNERLKRLLEEFQSNSNIIEDTKPLDEVDDVFEYYMSLRELMQEVNNSEGMLLIFIFVLTTLKINLDFYDFCRLVVLKVFTFNDVLSFIERLILCIQHVGSFLLLIEPCNGVHSELGETRLLLSELLCCALSALSPLSLQLRCFAAQLQHDVRVFAPLGILNMSRSLYTAVIGSISTYFSLIVNFSGK